MGLERAGFKTIAFCEPDEQCREVLSNHFDAWIWNEILDISGLSLPDIERGGPAPSNFAGGSEPCLRPDWIVIENVYHTWRRWVPELRRELHRRGYASLPLRVRAADVGGPHERARCFLLAHADCERLRQLSWWWQWEGRGMASELAKSWPRPPGPSRVDDGVSRGMDKARRRMLGNSVCPQIAEIIGRAIMAATDSAKDSQTKNPGATQSSP